MAWEQRGNRSYYYRSVRSGTRVTKEYIGGGHAASLIAQLEGIERDQQVQKRERSSSSGSAGRRWKNRPVSSTTWLT